MKHFSHFMTNRAPALTAPKALLMIIFGAMLASGLVITSNFVIEPTIAAAGNFEMIDQKPLFAANATPQFRVKTAPTLRQYVTGRSNKSNNNIGNIGTKVLDDENRPVDLQTKVQFNKQKASEFEVLISNDKDFRPGRYHLETKVKNEAKDITLRQDFLWGVLAINLDRSTYEPGQTVSVMMAALNDSGVTLCNASLDLSITDSSGQVSHRATASGEIITNPICEDKHVTDTPDYATTFKVDQIGQYQLTLTAETPNGRRMIRSTFEVKSNPDFVVSRPNSSMRIYPPSDYTVKIDLEARQNFAGQVIETVPASFTISQAGAKIKRQGLETATSALAPIITTVGSRQIISWDNIGLSDGDSVHIEYTYRAPPISPEFYLLGPLELKSEIRNPKSETNSNFESTNDQNVSSFDIRASNLIWVEPRAWQVASDAVVTWDGGGADGTCGGAAGDGNKWSCTLNWSGDALPTSADVATFDATSTKNANITAAIGTISGIDIKTGYTGTITNQVNTGTAVTLSTSFSQVTGTFDGGSTANIDNNGTFSLTGGTFTSTSGTFFVASTFTISGAPTFTHNSGTFTFDTSAVTLTPSTATFYKVSFASAVAKTIADSQTLTVANTLTLTDGSIAQTTIPAGGSIAAQGDVTQASTFDGGTGRLEITGTASQVLTGGGSATAGQLPDLEIDKSAGTLTLSSIIRTPNDWTYTAGTIAEGTSTVAIVPIASITLTGSMTFKSLTISVITNGTITVTISSGSTILVNGTLTLDCTAGTVALDGPGAISAKGDVIITGDTSKSGWAGTAVITINGTGAQALTGTTTSGIALNRLPAVVVDKSGGGTLTVSNIIQPRSGWTYTAGTLAMGTSTFEFNALQTITGSMSFYNLSFLKTSNTTSTITIASATTLTVTNTLTLNKTNVQGSEALNGPGAVTLTGNLAMTGTAGTSSGWGGTAIVTINGTGNQSITGTTDTGVIYNRVPAVTIAKSTGTLTFTNNLHFFNNFTYTSGNVTVGTGEVMFSGTSTITGSFTFYDLKFEKTTSTAMAVTIASGTVLTVSNTLTFNHTQATGTETIDGPGTITANGNFSVTGSTGTAGMNGSVAITFAGSSNTTYTTNTTTFPTGNVTISKSAGFKVSLLAAATFASLGQSLTITSGTLDLDGFGLNGLFTVNSGGNFQLAGGETVVNIPTLDAGSTVTYDGTAASYTIKNYTYRNLTIAGAASTVFTLPSNQTSVQTLTITTGILALGGYNLTATTLVNNDTLRMQGNETVSITTMDTDTGTVQYIGRNVAETLTIKDFGAGDYYNLTINDANVSKATFQSGAALDINGNLTLTAGTFNPNSFNTNVAGNWSNASSGNFLTGASTVVFDGTDTSSITGATTFSNLTSTTAGKVLKFEAQSGGAPVFTISGIFTVTGSSAYPIAIRSTIAGTQWLPHFLGAQTAVTYAYIEDSGCDVGTASVAPGVTNVYAGNNNGTCWTLPLKSRFSSGTVRIDGGTVRFQY